ncbi:MAG: class GN sortase [Cognaticolwellia sp.]
MSCLTSKKQIGRINNISRKVTAALLLTFGCVLTIQASWLPAKAWLSQQLIHHSWQQAMAGQKESDGRGVISQQIAIKPWPWADTFPIAELAFERLNKSIVVLNGGDPTTLAFSAGAIAPFNQMHATKPFVVAGHRDSHFSFLEDIAMKDVISLTDAQGQARLYQVESIDIVDGSSGQMPLLADESSLVLITCYPFQGIGSDSDERYVITATAL